MVNTVGDYEEGKLTSRILALMRYGPLGASSRLRQLQYLNVMHAASFRVQVQAFFDDDVLLRRYQRGHYRLVDLIIIYTRRLKVFCQRDQFDIIWIEKEALPWFPLWVEAIFLRDLPYVLDYDDAVFHNYDSHPLAIVRWFFGKRLDRLMSKAALVVAGNEYLAKRAHIAGAKWIEIVPTVVDLGRYPTPVYFDIDHFDNPLRIVWIGSPSTVGYLKLLEQPLRSISQKLSLVLRVVGAELKMTGVNIECIPWSEETEVKSISDCHLGVMPLFDSLWEQGKCGYKLIQYMACGLPVVGSPIGANVQIIESGVNGFFATSNDEWVSSLECLLFNTHLRLRMGKAGRTKVEAMYSIQVMGPKMVKLFTKVSKGI